jgi:peptidoglycan/LPS O-acetylase OafA/YrhL
MSPNVILVITALIYGIATYYVWIHGYSMKSGLVIFFSIPRFLLIWYLGVFLADKFVNSEHYKPISIKWLWFSVCIFLLSKCIRPFNENQILMAAIVSYIAIYICLGINWDSPKLIFRILANIGKCSYSIYLIHQPYMKDLMKSVSFLQLSKFHHQSLEFIDATIVFGIIYLISNSTYYLIEVKSINIGKSIYENIKNRGIFNCKGNQI